jgi:hypothetical protein
MAGLIPYTYDLETFSDCFLFIGKFPKRNCEVYEISTRKNQRQELLQRLSYLQALGVTMVGYNNLDFDYPIIHSLLHEPYIFDANKAYHLAQAIIGGQRFNRPQIPFKERILPQLDLMKLHHFDNTVKYTSLKSLQFAMRLPSVEDLPYDPHSHLTSEQMDNLVAYGCHDVESTEMFLYKSESMIKMRQDLIESGVLFGDVLNYSDVKIGIEYLCKKIGRNKCFISGSNPRQTLRSQVTFKDIVLPKINFRTEPYSSTLDWFKSQVVYAAKAQKPKLEATLSNLVFHFGVGGVHASVESRAFRSTDEYIIRDVDVGGMYPAIAVANGFAPEHLGVSFVQAYRQLKVDRDRYPKGASMNLTLKLANNGAFGNMGNPYSWLFDLKCLYSITINGQLQILQLAEMLASIPETRLIQANTDGITLYMRRDMEPFFLMWCEEWERQTNLKLEHSVFEKMWIRDVNNYLAVDTKGKVKRKGAYWYPITDEDYQGSSGSNWNKDFSNLVAPKAAELCMIYGYSPSEAVRVFSNPFDFMLRYKTPAGAKVFIGDVEQSRTTRYYVSLKGERMKKVSIPKGEIGTYKRANKIPDELWQRVMQEIPPGTWDSRVHTKNKSKYTEVTTGIESGRLVKNCNRASDFDWRDLDWNYYEKEIEKLVIGG